MYSGFAASAQSFSDRRERLKAQNKSPPIASQAEVDALLKELASSGIPGFWDSAASQADKALVAKCLKIDRSRKEAEKVAEAEAAEEAEEAEEAEAVHVGCSYLSNAIEMVTITQPCNKSVANVDTGEAALNAEAAAPRDGTDGNDDTAAQAKVRKACNRAMKKYSIILRKRGEAAEAATCSSVTKQM